MTRLLTLLFVILLGALLWLRQQPAKQPEQLLDAKEDITFSSLLAKQKVQPERAKLEGLRVRSVSDALPTAGEWRGKPALCDLNGDGKLDIAVSIRRFSKSKIADGIHVFLGDGKGGWTACDRGLSKDMGYGGTDAGDVNGDGRPDLCYSGHDLPPRVFLNFLAHKGQNEWVGLESVADLNGVSCSDVALGDFDGDGFADLAAMGFFPKTGGLYVMSNKGTGEWKPKQELLPSADYGAIVRFVDLDNDKRVELIAATSVGAMVWKFADGAWIDQSDGLPTTSGTGEIGGIIRGITAMDFDGDGLPELAVGCLPNTGHAPVRLFRREGGRWVAWGWKLPIEESCFDLVAARLPGNEKGLYLACKHGAVVVHCKSDGECRVVGQIEKTEGVLNVGAGDVDGDGVDEMLILGQMGLRMVAIDFPVAAAR